MTTYLTSLQVLEKLRDLTCPSCGYKFTKQDRFVEKVGPDRFLLHCPSCEGIQSLDAVASGN
jgi:hypothetical protein